MGIRMARIVFLLAAALGVMPISTLAAERVEVLGIFSNQVSSSSDDPHLEGYSVTLYREGKILFGRFCWATGIEVPCAPLQDAFLGPNGKLEFAVRLSAGTEISKATGPKGRPARNLIGFSGKWSTTRIDGQLSKRNGYDLSLPAEVEKIVLERSDAVPDDVTSHDEWANDPLNTPANW